MKETLLAGLTVALFFHLMAAKLIQIKPSTPSEGMPLATVTTTAHLSPPLRKETPELRYLPPRARLEPRVTKQTKNALQTWLSFDEEIEKKPLPTRETLVATALVNGRTGEVIALRSEVGSPLDLESERRKLQFPPDPLGTYYTLLVPIELQNE